MIHEFKPLRVFGRLIRSSQACATCGAHREDRARHPNGGSR